ncbi:hypothetical protein PTTG_07818 [Puccinia triticina 1-1 BBBD Race 1]|uniref:Uncharacterized protein n=2 Tax=Puccinia triticina TaxID=208348 RepID=A0A0C4F3Y4_PUCT1|nr:uncharacterized protein PtA15_15A212 [Puccinia triticina]OAV91031.1 hypothetical protein PTTG_07818 [Puccinia triticina 1-1 BBBD Race 1]WAQ91820.1 hypothetical protein PtA15_15A212 [Puccinia triticina]WAR62615.1 hypothetical protein PtB15_15B201 [Puccinia triticina]
MSHSSLNPTKDMMSGMDSGMDDNMMNRDRQGDDQGLMGKMASMVGGNKNNDQSGQNQSSKMMGGVGGGAGRDSNRGQEASMGDKVKGTYEQAKGKVMNDPHTARKGDMRKNPGGNDSNDFMTTSGI